MKREKRTLKIPKSTKNPGYWVAYSLTNAYFPKYWMYEELGYFDPYVSPFSTEDEARAALKVIQANYRLRGLLCPARGIVLTDRKGRRWLRKAKDKRGNPADDLSDLYNRVVKDPADSMAWANWLKAYIRSQPSDEDFMNVVAQVPDHGIVPIIDMVNHRVSMVDVSDFDLLNWLANLEETKRNEWMGHRAAALTNKLEEMSGRLNESDWVEFIYSLPENIRGIFIEWVKIGEASTFNVDLKYSLWSIDEYVWGENAPGIYARLEEAFNAQRLPVTIYTAPRKESWHGAVIMSKNKAHGEFFFPWDDLSSIIAYQLEDHLDIDEDLFDKVVETISRNIRDGGELFFDDSGDPMYIHDFKLENVNFEDLMLEIDAEEDAGLQGSNEAFNELTSGLLERAQWLLSPEGREHLV